MSGGLLVEREAVGGKTARRPPILRHIPDVGEVSNAEGLRPIPPIRTE